MTDALTDDKDFKQWIIYLKKNKPEGDSTYTHCLVSLEKRNAAQRAEDKRKAAVIEQLRAEIERHKGLVQDAAIGEDWIRDTIKESENNFAKIKQQAVRIEALEEVLVQARHTWMLFIMWCIEQQEDSDIATTKLGIYMAACLCKLNNAINAVGKEE